MGALVSELERGDEGVQEEIARLSLELSEHHELYAAIFDGAPVAMFLVNAAGRVVSVNHATEAAMGQDRQDILGLLGGQVIRCVNAFVGDGCGRGEPCKVCPVRTSVEQTFATGQGVYKREGSLTVGAGDAQVVRHFLVTTTRIVIGKDEEVLVALDDITERKQIEVELRRLTDQLEEQVAERSTELRAAVEQVAQADRLASMGLLAAGVAHEVNNPLTYVLYNLESLAEDTTALRGALDHLRSQLEARLGPGSWADLLGDRSALLSPAALGDAAERFAAAVAGSRRIADVVHGLSSFSRVDEEEVAPVDLHRVVDNAVSMANNEIRYRARLVRDFGPVPAVLANEGRLSQVLLNLLINAAQAIEEGNVEDNEIRVSCATDDEAVRIEVSDTGPGIAPDQLDRVFEPFYSSKRVGEGTGLGLTISKNIVESYGGHIAISSRLGEGTTVRIGLPVPKQDSEPASDSATPPSEPAALGRVLVVDDEAPVRSAVTRMLRGHEVIQAASGAEARRILEADRNFDVVLCDMMMPDGSGMELHRWLADDGPELADRLVFITGGAFTPRAREYLSRAGRPRLEKPFDPGQLRQTVEGIVRDARDGRRTP